MNQFYINGDFWAINNNAGVGRVASELLLELDKIIEKKIQITLLIPQNTYKVPNYNHINVEKIGKENESLNHWKWHTLPCYVKAKKGVLIDITQALPIKCRHIVFIHDTIPELYKSDYNTLKKKLLRIVKLIQRKKCARSAEKIITISNFSKKCIIDSYKVEESKIEIISPAWNHFKKVNPSFKYYNENKLESVNYIFTLGSNVEHKNMKWIFEAARQNPKYTFLVTGLNNYSKLYECDNLKYTGFLSDEEIKGLMIKCQAFILPSFIEGFGIPPMEAMSCGTKVIISNIECFKEIYKNSAIFINPYSYDKIDMDYLLEQKSLNYENILNEYQWEKSARKLLNILMEGK